MLAIPVSILVLLAIVAVAASPLLAMVIVGLLFAAFLGYAWRGPVGHPGRVPAMTGQGQGALTHSPHSTGWISTRRLAPDSCGARRRAPLARPFSG